jgi:transglutaminase-like putative cysteine protease
VNRDIRGWLIGAVVSLGLSFSAHAFPQSWIAPTPAELAMTSIAEVPGAAAVYLSYEEVDDDLTHFQTVYARIKVLTEAGKDYANVEIPFVAGEEGAKIAGIAGRTIQPDGTIVPYTGKPFEKLVQKANGYTVMEKVFSLPSVEVGSIIEYRYRLEYSFDQVRSPLWNIQGDLYVRSAHYIWRPTIQDVVSRVDGENITSHVAHTQILPKGVEVQKVFSPNQLELTVHDIPPAPHDEFMPPLESVRYYVRFYYTGYKSEEEFWNSAGKRWSKEQNAFIGPHNGVKAAVKEMVAASDTADQKLHKFYAAVMAMENTDYTRQHSTREDKAEGLRETKNTDDILARKRGSSDQLAELFLAMARAAGIKAYAMGVADRRRRLFVPAYLSTDQLDDIIAIVNVDGKEEFFDPGTRYCSYGHLSWRHGLLSGLRQTDGGVALATAPGEGYGAAHVVRVADLTMDDTGKVAGTLKFSYTGDPALRWRQQALLGDEASLEKQLRESVEEMLPAGMQVDVLSVQHAADYDAPLVVEYSVSGAIGTPAGKRMLIPAALLEGQTKPLFPQEKRDVPVDMHYAFYDQDAVLLKLPPSLAVEALPANAQVKLPGAGSYGLSVQHAGQTVRIQRDMALAKSLFYPDAYPGLRTFYNQLQTKDREPVVLTRAAATPASGGRE